MDSTPVALFVNHLQQACGVYQFFKRMVMPVVNSCDTYWYIETNDVAEHDYWIEQIKPEIVVYNFYFSGSTMGWLTNAKVNQQRNRFKQMCLFHEGSVADKGFDLVLHQNPYNTDGQFYNLPRPIPIFTPVIHPANVIPTIGSFGFGLGGKGFGTLVDKVCAEFDIATIRINIPFAYFGDVNGDGARWWANHCYALLAAHNKPNVKLVITHDLLPEQELLQFLYGNDLNAFLYDHNIGRGISGTLDYALAVNKPIAITQSDQFRHMWNDIHLIEKHTLKEIMAAGTDHLQQYKDMWNDKAMIQAYNTAFNNVLGR